jgi:hypothetical protein
MAEKEWEGEFDPMADPDEQKHILSVLDSFRYAQASKLDPCVLEKQN